MDPQIQPPVQTRASRWPSQALPSGLSARGANERIARLPENMRQLKFPLEGPLPDPKRMESSRIRAHQGRR